MSQLIEALNAFAEAANMRLLAPGAGNAKAPAQVPIADKLTLSLKEVAALAGFSGEYLLDAYTADT